jgi:predicted dehydrogenase
MDVETLADNGVEPLGSVAAAPAHTYRAGIIGGGFMGRVHARAVRVAGGRVVALASSSPDRAARAAADIGAERAVGSVEALVGSDDVDVVHVCTPNHLHHPVAMAAVAAGKHVVCEKPLATSHEEARELVDAVTANGLVGTVPFVYRFHPMVREARARVRSGEMGRVLLTHGSYLQDWLSNDADNNWRVDADLGGPSRAFADIGSHWCDLVEFVTGDRISALSGQMATIAPNRHGDGRVVTTEDMATVQFRTEAGVLGSVVISQVSPGRKNRLLLEISCSEGSLAFDQEQPERLWHGRRDASQDLLRDPDTLSAAAARYSRLPAGHAQGYQDCFDAFVADTGAAIGGAAPDGLPTFEDGLRSAHVVDAVLRSSAADGRWEAVCS